MKKRIDIEKLLKWTYCEELPKALKRGGKPVVEGSNFYSIVQLAVLGTRVDTSGGTPDHQLAGFFDETHPDALKIHEAVLALDDLEVELPEDWWPFPELAEMGAYGEAAMSAAIASLTKVDEDGHRLLKRPMSSLIQKHAILGGCPNAEMIVPELKVVTGENGGPIWFRKVGHTYYDDDGTRVKTTIELEDGWDKHRRRPKRGAYQKFYLDPDPVPMIVAQGEYELWVAGMRELSQNLFKTDYWRNSAYSIYPLHR
jgi:hypothetical protein